jgi:hypothetical protein
MKAQGLGLGFPIKFSRIWQGLLTAEWLSHSRLENVVEGKLYRDHIFHPAAVAMLGRELLKRMPARSRRAAANALQVRFGGGYRFSEQDGQTWLAVLEHAWLLAAFFHDHCCPYEGIAKTLKSADSLGFRKPDILKHFRDEAPGLVTERLIDRACAREIRCKLDSHPHCHAPIGAISLCTLKRQAKGDFQRAVVDAAADAVLWHHGDLRSIDYRFGFHPLRYLLVACDGLHEFNRELLHRLDWGDGRFVSEFRESCTHAKLRFGRSFGALRFTYHVNCAERVCDTRWQIELFENGLKDLRAFLRCCGPFDVDYDVKTDDCDSCRCAKG